MNRSAAGNTHRPRTAGGAAAAASPGHARSSSSYAQPTSSSANRDVPRVRRPSETDNLTPQQMRMRMREQNSLLEAERKVGECAAVAHGTSCTRRVDCVCVLPVPADVTCNVRALECVMFYTSMFCASTNASIPLLTSGVRFVEASTRQRERRAPAVRGRVRRAHEAFGEAVW